MKKQKDDKKPAPKVVHAPMPVPRQTGLPEELTDEEKKGTVLRLPPAKKIRPFGPK
jgi:hypothetical protein